MLKKLDATTQRRRASVLCLDWGMASNTNRCVTLVCDWFTFGFTRALASVFSFISLYNHFLDKCGAHILAKSGPYLH